MSDQISDLPPFFSRKVSGILLPLFSVKTNKNFGVGEILDLIPLIDWMTENHLHVLQILPICETSPMETCPYLALSGIALDPIYLSVTEWPDFKKSPIAQEDFVSPESQADLRGWRESDKVCYEAIRRYKTRLMTLAFQHFIKEEWEQQTRRARSLQTFITEKSAWIEDYALFRLIKEKNNWSHWFHWPKDHRDRDPVAIQTLQHEEKDRLLFIKYLQWACWEQWKQVRTHVNKRNVLLMGDLPFLVSQDSADVWGHRDVFSSHDTFGAPPDAFSKTGQDWGLPVFHWEEMEKRDFFWWRMRVREFRKIYDLIRLDHVVGFYRIWVIPKKGAPYFQPHQTEQQARRGAKLLHAILDEAGPCLTIAEDLGVIPDFVARSLKELKIAGHKILRWEKPESLQGQYADPRQFPFLSLATTGTHDTDTLVTWWKSLPQEERVTFLTMIDANLTQEAPTGHLSEALHTAILDRLMGAGSALVLLPIQDVFGFQEQINQPATVGDHNWRYRLPATLSVLQQKSPYREKLQVLKKIIDRHQRYWAFVPLIQPRSRHPPIPVRVAQSPASGVPAHQTPPSKK